MQDEIDGEVIPVEPDTVVGSIAKAEADIQIATAKQYPRSIRKFLDDTRALVTLSEDVAGECMYALPRGGKTIEGPSARFAEVILSAWGNSHGAARVVGEDDKFVTAQAVVWDLEKNVKIAFETRRRITNKYGNRYDDDMIGVTGNAAASIAFRNAVLKVVPKAFWNQLYHEARRTAIGDAKTLSTRRADAIAALAKMGVTEEMILARLERKGIEDIDLDDLAVLRGFFTAIRDEGASVESVFSAPVEGSKARKGTLPLTGKSANKPESTPETPPEDATADTADRIAAAISGDAGDLFPVDRGSEDASYYKQ